MTQAQTGMDSTALFAQLDRYNVTWTTPSQTDRAAMPLGNGEVGVSLWVQADGEVHFYIARTDARTECDRSVKLGKVRLKLTPAAHLCPLDASGRRSSCATDASTCAGAKATRLSPAFRSLSMPISRSFM